jgi:alpha-L-fucosidase
MPAESDFPLRDGWFWHPGGLVKTAGDLVNRYFTSVGRNSVMNIGIAPDRRGLICDEDAQALEGLGTRISTIFATNLARSARIVASHTLTGFPVENLMDGNPHTFWASEDGAMRPEVTLEFGRPCTFSVVRIREAITLGQRVEEWALDQWGDGRWQEFCKASGIGAERLWRGEPMTTLKIRLRILRSASPPVLSELGVYLEPEGSRREAGHALGVTLDHGLDKSKWRIVSASSEGTPAVYAIDGNSTTFWQTSTGNGSPAVPQELVVDMGVIHEVTGFLYLPRQDHCTVGNVSRYVFYLSEDAVVWGDPVAQGEFGNIKANPVQQKVTLARPHRARYMKFIALSVVDGNYVAVAEIGVMVEDVGLVALGR